MKKITIKNASNGYIIDVESETYNGYHDTQTFVESDENGLKSRLGELTMQEYSSKKYYTDCRELNITIE